jgi:proteasome lid subunit RPN8/RPN11
MSDDVTDEIEPVKFIDNIPLFYADHVNALTQIERAGYSIYYVLASEKIEHKNAQNVVTYTFAPNIWRVDSTMIGRSVVAVDPTKDADLWCELKNTASYTLPLMPWEFTQKIDAFFRKVFEVHGTESILVLTYDESYFNSTNPSEGWGCITPKQNNTAMDCHYEMDSVMQVKPEDVTIVGTWHSHPEMSAFFSGTDHKDQDDWDGIHITTGWMKGKPSEWHLALILNGHNWVLDPKQVFATPPIPELDVTEVDTWMENVEKKVWTSSTTTGHSSQHTGHGTSPYTPNKTFPTPHVPALKLPPDAPDPTKNLIIAQVDWENVRMQCPFCLVPVSKSIVKEHRCGRCSSFFISKEETIWDLVAERTSSGKPYVLEIDPERAPHPIILWEINNITGGTFSQDVRSGADSPK